MEKITEVKKALILNSINAGMSMDRACIMAELTQKQIETIYEDEDLMSIIATEEVRKERELLDRYDKALTIAAERGQTEPIKWLLGKLFPERWGEKKQEFTLPVKLVIDGDDAKVL